MISLHLCNTLTCVVGAPKVCSINHFNIENSCLCSSKHARWVATTPWISVWCISSIWSAISKYREEWWSHLMHILVSEFPSDVCMYCICTYSMCKMHHNTRYFRFLYTTLHTSTTLYSTTLHALLMYTMYYATTTPHVYVVKHFTVNTLAKVFDGKQRTSQAIYALHEPNNSPRNKNVILSAVWVLHDKLYTLHEPR